MMPVYTCGLTAALFEDNCAAEFVEPLSIEAWPVNWHGVLQGGAGNCYIYVAISHKIQPENTMELNGSENVFKT